MASMVSCPGEEVECVFDQVFVDLNNLELPKAADAAVCLFRCWDRHGVVEVMGIAA